MRKPQVAMLFIHGGIWAKRKNFKNKVVSQNETLSRECVSFFVSFETLSAQSVSPAET